MNALLVSGGRVIDPANNFDAQADVLVKEGKIAAVGPNLASQTPANCETLDATGWWSARPDRYPRPPP